MLSFTAIVGTLEGMSAFRVKPLLSPPITSALKSGDISIVVSDEGEGFDLSEVPDPTAPGSIYSTHGRGIYLMKAFMDEVRFEHGGSVVRMRKRGAVSIANSACASVRTAPA